MLRSVPIRGNEKLFDGERYYFFNSYNPTSVGKQYAKRDAAKIRKLRGKVKARVVMESGFPVVYTRPRLEVK